MAASLLGIIQTMDFTLHQTFPEDLKSDWNELLTESILNVPFLRFEYLKGWWQTRGGGEWPQDSQLVLVTAHQNDALVGVAPLFSAQYEGQPSLLFLGSIEISDFLSFIVRPQDLQSFLSGLLDFLCNFDQVPAWQVLDLHNNLSIAGLPDALEAEAIRRSWQYRCEQSYHAPVICLPDDWDGYLAGLDKKQRHEIRRKIRRLEEADPSTRWYIVSEGTTLAEESQAFLQLMAHDPQKEVFLSGSMHQTMLETIQSAFDAGYLQLAFLEINGKKAAAYLNFDFDDRLWVYNSGIDPEFYPYSAGWVLLAYLLQWSIENKRTAFDFLRGNEDYKYRFGATDRFVYRIRLTRP
ncbi:MAG: hypothetical protein BGO78_05195 [Chloroflexi bacterium 44-23]|nr:MAG: hypothetical protein BGO78_05195 [Chloroflexi bacterium 44-23]